ncbi:DNA excision repair protein ERCC-6-like 2 isoform X2 [Dendronephthya gigantea]|uniref:DNA excision repair protein ERCC-6-like 2 isoform X2 n=1 Tax=Dendronephthya gigantea TaxID=151771 RepID=UPI00106AE2B6|nr:DNA excision repair protein ERCC-6-like 2 isoform X2 [Dendronephthya gigantea]
MLEGDSASEKQNHVQRPERGAEGTNCAVKRHIFDDVHGFTDEDLEKPNFPLKSSSEKIPFYLSDVDKPPIVQVPSTINQYLREYQKEGIAFLYRQYSRGEGAILADDMGLGKTVQVIGFISAVLGKTGTKMDIYGKFLSENDKNKVSLCNHVKKEKGSFLIVSPNSVLYNWHDELMTWGYFKIGKFHKSKRDETFQKALSEKLDVVLTTYETLRNHWETLNRIKWLAVIMDEVHYLKDPKRAVTIASKSLNIKCRLLDFWSVLDWATPGCLGDKEDFINDFGKPIMQGQRFDGTKRELATGRKKTQEFQSLIDRWCLRRTKALIADQLPQKDQKVVFCPLSNVQEEIYKTLLQTNDVQLVLKQGEPCDCRSELTRGTCCYAVNEEGSTMKKLLLQCLRLFLKISNHAALLLPHVKQTDDQRKRAKAVCEKVFAVHPEFERASKSPSFELFSDSNFCGKMKVLDKLLKLFQQEKDKVLLFSYSTQLLDMLEAYVISCGMVYRRLDGKTRGERRLDVVREFNTNANVFLFLVSTKAGGVGLNLTSANIVIVFDPSWNPADDLQAEDRAYRIGQRRDVKVFRLISTGTVEENMYLRQIYKQQLANVAVEGNNERRYFTAVDGVKNRKGELFGIENLFTLRIHGCSVSTDIFKRSDKIERGFRMAQYELLPNVDMEKKMISEQSIIPLAQCKEPEDENDSYNLDEITSQFIEDDATNIDCLQDNPAEHDLRSEVLSQHDNDEKHNDEKQKMKFTKVLEEKREKVIITPLHDDDKKKRKNIRKSASPSKKRPISKDSLVNQILEDCGVRHTHSNKIIIGSSEAENAMTSRAMKEVFDLGQCSQQPANCFAAIESDGDESDDIGEPADRKSSKTEENFDFQKTEVDNYSSPKKVHTIQTKISVQSKANGRTTLYGETPKTIRIRQFMEISETRGFKSEIEFARTVVSCNTKERLDMLMNYYKTKKYPSDSIEFFSQTSQSSQDDKTSSNSRKYSTNSEGRYRKSSTRKKCFTKSSVFKPKKSDRSVMKESKLSKSRTGSTARSRVVSQASDKIDRNRVGCSTIEPEVGMSSTTNNAVKSLDNCKVNNVQLKNDQTKSNSCNQMEANPVISSKCSEDRTSNGEEVNCSDYSLARHTSSNTSSCVSPKNNENVSEDILNDILTACSVANTSYTRYRSSPNTGLSSNIPAITNSPQGSQSSFLDEFLFECSQRTCKRAAGTSSRNEPQKETTDNIGENKTCEKMPTSSIIDDLI